MNSGYTERRDPGNDAVKVPRKSLGFHHCLAATCRVSPKIGFLRSAPIVMLHDRLTRQCGNVSASICMIEFCLQIVVRPHSLGAARQVSHVRNDAGIAAMQRTIADRYIVGRSTEGAAS